MNTALRTIVAITAGIAVMLLIVAVDSHTWSIVAIVVGVLVAVGVSFGLKRAEHDDRDRVSR